MAAQIEGLGALRTRLDSLERRADTESHLVWCKVPGVQRCPETHLTDTLEFTLDIRAVPNTLYRNGADLYGRPGTKLAHGDRAYVSNR